MIVPAFVSQFVSRSVVAKGLFEEILPSSTCHLERFHCVHPITHTIELRKEEASGTLESRLEHAFRTHDW